MSTKTKNVKSNLSLSILLLFFLYFPTFVFSIEINNDYREFSLRKQIYAKGNMKSIGNTALVPPNPNSTSCSTYTNGNYYTDVGTANSYWNLCGYQVDTGTSNSTTSELDIPAGAKVLWAGIYWQALVDDHDFSTTMTLKIKKNNGSYKDFSYDNLDYLSGSGKSGYTSYAAFKDITNIFDSDNSVSWGEGNYTVANIPVYEGKVGILGTYGAWNLVVIYEDDSDKYRSFSIFDGWKVVKNSNGYREVDIPVSGFYTPDRSNLNANVSVFAAEGDKHIYNDYLKTYDYNNGNSSVELTPSGITNQTFNSSISGTNNRTPNLINNNGIDIQTHAIGAYLAPKQKDMTFQFTSDQDTYWPSMIAFNTELYEPKICYDFSYRQNGVELDITSDLGNKPLLDTYLESGPIEVGIYFRNKESDLYIEKLSFKTNMDSNTTSKMPYTLNSTYMSSISGSVLEGPVIETIENSCDYNSSSTSPQVCTNNGNIRVGLGRLATGYSQEGAGELGSSEYQFFKFDLNNTLSGRQLIDFNMSIDYYIIPENGTPIPRLNRFLGQEIDICSENTNYTPIWGIFNIAESGSNYYNLKTQIAKKPFSVNLQYFEKDSVTGEYTVDTPSRDINTTVRVEIFDVEPFHDAQAACVNPTAHTSKPIYLNVILNQNEENYVQIPPQSPDYYNFAIKNAAFRVWHFNDANGALLENFSIDVNGTSSNGLYNPIIHKDCIVKCSDAENSSTCVQCIQSKYATPICSRDNFSIRPEAFDIRVNDINQTTKDVNSKIDLSAQFNYSPNSTSNPTSRMNLATGYEIVYDINATNHQDLNGTPWYVRTLDIQSIWDPQQAGLVCNDDSNYTAQVGFGSNGKVSNKNYKQAQVGEYKISLKDTSWTNVDVSKSHHKAPYFDLSANSDCTQNSNISSGATMGCEISSNHINTSLVPNHIYRDINITFKPYKFKIPTIFFPNFRYMANVDNNASTAMSIQYIGDIEAKGFDDSTPSNYVGGCYANDINVSFSGSIELNGTAYQLRFIDYNSSNVVQANFTRDINNSINNNFDDLNLTSTFFRTDNNGAMDINISMNYERNTSIPINPQTVRFERVDINCTVSSNCQINANLSNDFIITGSYDFADINITHYYGRVHAPDQRFDSATGTAQVYYEVYCDDCNKTDFNITGDESIDSINWFTNTLHVGSDGNVSAYNPLGTVSIGTISSINNGEQSLSLSVTSTPHKDKISMTSSPWLVYSPTDFMVEFYGSTGQWAGEGIQGKTVDLNVSKRQNKRLDW